MGAKFVELQYYPEIEGFIDVYDDLEDGSEEFKIAEEMYEKINDEISDNDFHSIDRGDTPVEVFNVMKRFMEKWNGETIYWINERGEITFSCVSPQEFGDRISDAIDKVVDEYTKKGLWPIKPKATRKKR